MEASLPTKDLPKRWRPAAQLINVILAVVVATVGALAFASFQTKDTAHAEAVKVVAPVAQDLAVHEAAEEKQHQWDGQRLNSIERKIDRLLDRGEPLPRR